MKFKHNLLVTILSLAFTVANAQMENPVKWSYTAKKIADKTFELHITAMLDDKWHIYAQDAGKGPVPTSFSFSKNPLVKLEGKVREEGKQETAFDQNFNSTLKFYSRQVDFVQKIKLKSAASTMVKGQVTFMVCNDRRCLPPKDLPFAIQVSGK